MRSLPRVWSSASVAAAATEIRDSGLPVVGVTEGFFFVAVVTQASLAAALTAGIHPDEPVDRAFDKNAPTLPPYASAERALEIFSTGGVSAIPVVDDYGHLMGVVTPADLYPKRDRAPRPTTVGGMATPFGVYLTTGRISAGATGWPLVATGAVMSVRLVIITILASYLNTYSLHHLHHALPDSAISLLSFLAFLITFRFSPLAGIHAAEHKVVHAIERGEELTRENVRRMPRVHPRCGTNLVVGLSILTLVITAVPPKSDSGTLSLYIMAGAIATSLFWRPLGSLAQYWGTTKEPTDKQLDMGIRSGEELLKTYATGPGGRSGFFWRIWNMGILQVMAGAGVVMGLFFLVAPYLGVDLTVLTS